MFLELIQSELFKGEFRQYARKCCECGAISGRRKDQRPVALIDISDAYVSRAAIIQVGAERSGCRDLTLCCRIPRLAKIFCLIVDTTGSHDRAN